MREEATVALACAARQPKVQERLLALTRDKSERVHVRAVDALTDAASEPEIQKLLLELTRDESEWVRDAAVWALAS